MSMDYFIGLSDSLNRFFIEKPCGEIFEIKKGEKKFLIEKLDEKIEFSTKIPLKSLIQNKIMNLARLEEITTKREFLIEVVSARYEIYCDKDKMEFYICSGGINFEKRAREQRLFLIVGDSSKHAIAIVPVNSVQLPSKFLIELCLVDENIITGMYPSIDKEKAKERLKKFLQRD